MSALALPMCHVVLERVDAGGRHVEAGSEIPVAVEADSLFRRSRRRIAALALPMRDVMLKRVDAGRRHVGVGSEVPVAVEADSLFRRSRCRIAALIPPAWILERSATGLREADLNVLSKLGNQGLEGRLEPEAFTGGEVGGEDDLLDFLVGCPVDIQVARQPST